MARKKQVAKTTAAKGKRKVKDIEEAKEKPAKKLKPGIAKKNAKSKAKTKTKEEAKEPKVSKTSELADFTSDSLNSYEDFVGHLGDWQEPLVDYLASGHFRTIYEYVKEEYDSTLCFPPKELIFNAFQKASFKNTKVVIVGQDPYIKVNEAMGL